MNGLANHYALAWIGRIFVILVVLVLLGGGALNAQVARARTYSLAVADWGFDLVRWEANAITEKLHADVTRPSSGIEPDDASRLVVQYMERARAIYETEDDIARLISEGVSQSDPRIAALEDDVERLRTEQDASRSTIEQIVERQIGYGLAQEQFTLLGLPFPPVQFTFTEPPKKLIVSPRDEIIISQSNMLVEDMPITAIEQAETAINAGDRERAYITNIGGLGAFPTMVVDDASLAWILSTVAHEWTHNYLAMFPLGWSYFKNQDMTTINETVADIVGDEVGANVGVWYYGHQPRISEPFADDEEATETLDAGESNAGKVDASEEEAEFDFRVEMRATRLEVDRLLNEGYVDEAEDYMEQRRQFFVANGYPLRVLNQAYFAFHGSYGKSASSTSPIGPKLRELRSLTPDLKTFVDVVKRLSNASELDDVLAQWRP